ncbi:unnamed protein product [Tilletia laevis]|uniref:RlpA-like protein double-psi beta-barrel domain-containing protein n=3 Tax=Tilletia TaxID=13289 RepID=A0A8X7MR01_9BASI|nr:hypothetical protein CF336_g4816 [Tilletia laevis]KAE8245832.1 hypothetical protein A4X06_0g5386 [Tilletia controversa]CAD6887170.1 unnamed protein product [Tilletia caries]KAE8200337.1 hypothetical protein CF335_g3979 [Tilletia laevis]CAD6905501.1 unnamed protein product [Tilletia laevis]
MRTTSTIAAVAAAVVIAFTANSNNVADASSSHNAIRRPSIPRRLDSASGAALSDPVAERGLLEALFGNYGGTGTWYGVGVSMGACGQWTGTDERAVALNIGLYGNEDAQSGWCGKKLKITANGKTSIATVVDCCPTCPGNGDLDMSKTLFQDFAGIGDGVVDIKWSWVGAGGGDDDEHSGKGNSASSHHDNNDDDEEEKPKPKPKPSPKPTPKPSPKPKTTSTKTKTSTKTSSTSKSTTTATSTTTSTATKEDKKKPKKTQVVVESNLMNLDHVITGLQNMAMVGKN